MGTTCPFTDQFIAAAAFPADWNNMGVVPATYNKRWKGPYIDGNPEAFFADAWGVQ